jgi:hypothetical protein
MDPELPLEVLTMERPLASEMGSVLVSVLDANGLPAAGLPIGLWTKVDDPAEDSAPAEERRGHGVIRRVPTDQGVTDANGSVVLNYPMPTGLELPYFHTRIEPQLAFQEHSRSETGPGELPAPVVILRLPPTGTVHVSVVPAELAVRYASSVEARIDGQLGRDAPVVEGEALLAFVELGRTLELQLTTAAMENRKRKTSVRGPEVPGEVVEVGLTLDIWPTLRFRAGDEAGRPLAHATLAARIHHGRLWPQPGSARTDADGVAEFVVYGDARNDDAREFLLWSLSPPRLAQVWLPEVLETPTELGNITLQRVTPGSVPPP